MSGPLNPARSLACACTPRLCAGGLEQAHTAVVLTDGARYNHTIIQTHFPDAVHIVDLFHASEHLTALAQILGGLEAKAPKAWRDWVESGDIGWRIPHAREQ